MSSSAEVLHDRVEPYAVGHDLQLREPGRPLDGMVNAVGIGDVNLVWVRYGGGGVIVDTPPVEAEFAMCAPQAPMDVEYRRSGRKDVAGGLLVLSQDEGMRMSPHPLLGCLVMSTSTDRLTRHLAAFLGRPDRAPLEIRPDEGEAIMPAPLVERTWRHVCHILDEIAADGPPHPLLGRALEESLLNAVLLGLPHSAADALTQPPRDRRRHHLAGFIEDWVRAHHAEPIGVTDIAAAAGIGVRQLQAVCRAEWGVTPVQFLRDVRLDHARAALLAAEPKPGAVAAIATAAGYLHKSRFATHYRERFGESPSQTLASRTHASRRN
ncbi:AraC family transcriptional regulator [Actinomadura rupiterrae]|uniref:AraC family transcriptional regulator n=1 Tax=Actinomadura rupiterrae TaxID=559627 RepID=UPI0020A398EE|nr:helix-turn-helix domain-containing protein [Actinomadura rupiterrae]MCP2336106.1 AraC-like DNA-binding protein [Actinomadura rupiterrae]